MHLFIDFKNVITLINRKKKNKWLKSILRCLKHQMHHISKLKDKILFLTFLNLFSNKSKLKPSFKIKAIQSHSDFNGNIIS